MAIIIYKSGIPLYWDSDKAFAKSATSTWNKTGVHQTVNQVQRDGLTVYAINDPDYGYTVGWVRSDELGSTGVNTEEELRHIVRQGETLWGIANQYKTTVTNLRAWNNLRGDLIRNGQSLIVRLGKTTVIEEDEDTGKVIEVIPTAMTIEMNGATVDLAKGINDNSGIKLAPGMNRLRIKGDGVISFHFRNEVMG